MAFPVLPPRSHLPSRVLRAMKLRQKELRRPNKDDELECHAATRVAGIARNPKMGNPRPSTLWKDRIGERANRKFNSGSNAELRHAARRAEIDERTSFRKAEKRVRHMTRLAGIAACADLDEDGADWGDDIVTHDTVTTEAESAFA